MQIKIVLDEQEPGMDFIYLKISPGACIALVTAVMQAADKNEGFCCVGFDSGTVVEIIDDTPRTTHHCDVMQ